MRPSSGDSCLPSSVTACNFKDYTCFINGNGRCGSSHVAWFSWRRNKKVGGVSVDGECWNV